MILVEFVAGLVADTELFVGNFQETVQGLLSLHATYSAVVDFKTDIRAATGYFVITCSMNFLRNVEAVYLALTRPIRRLSPPIEPSQLKVCGPPTHLFAAL
jgi:hypothetical protein